MKHNLERVTDPKPIPNPIDAYNKMAMAAKPARRKRYVFNHQPISWERAGINWNQRRIYDKQSHEKLVMGMEFKRQHGADGDNKPFTGPIMAHVVFYMDDARPVPMRKDTDYYHFQVPDTDNLEGFLWDTAQKSGIITNDKIIAVVIKQKLIDRYNPRTELTLMELPR